MATPPESVLSHNSAPVASQLDRGRKALNQNHHSSLVILPSDGELLMLFTQDADEAAFDRLVERHGGMVWRVCRGVLLAQQDVEDAYQATFLLLASKANKIHANESAAGWLYRVAHRTALAAKRRAKRRREESLEADPAAPPEEAFPNLVGRQMVSLLLEELRAMPKKYQTPLVMRYLEGQSRRSIADQTDMTVAAVQGKLARGKQLLRRRLVRRGVSLSVAMGVVGAASQTSLARSSEAASPTLIAQTAADCHALAAGGGSLAASSAVLALYQEGTRAMLFASMTKPAATLVACSLAAALWVGSGAGGSEPTNDFSGEGKGAFQISSKIALDENVEEEDSATVLLAQSDTSSSSNSTITREFEAEPSGMLQSSNALLLPDSMPEMKFGDMSIDGKKLTDEEQIEVLKKMWAERALKIPNLRLNNRPTIKELYTQHTYWETRYDALRNKVATIQRLYGNKPLGELSPVEQMELADAAVLSAEIFHARAEGLRLERELMIRSVDTVDSAKNTPNFPESSIDYGEARAVTEPMNEVVRSVRETDLYGSSQQLLNSPPLLQNQNRSVYLDQPRQQQNYNNNQLAQNWGRRTQTISAPSQVLLDQIEQQNNADYNSPQLPIPRRIYNPPSRQANSTSKNEWGKSHTDSTKSVDEALVALKGMINVSAGECYSLKQVWDNITQRLEERINNKEWNNKTDIEKVVDQLTGEELFILKNDLTLLKSYGYSKKNLDRYLATSDELLHYWMVLDGQKDLLDSEDPNKIIYSPRVIEKAKLYVDQITKIRASIERVEAKLPPQEVQNDLAAAVRKNQDKIIHRQDSGSLEIKNFTDQQTKDFELLQKIQTGDKQVPQAIDIIRDVRQRSGNTISGSPNRPPTSSFKSLSELIRDYDDSVEELQEALNQQLDPSPELDVDGDYGPLTKAAVRKFQDKAKIPPTGFADEATREALGLKDQPQQSTTKKEGQTQSDSVIGDSPFTADEALVTLKNMVSLAEMDVETINAIWLNNSLSSLDQLNSGDRYKKAIKEVKIGHLDGRELYHLQRGLEGYNGFLGTKSNFDRHINMAVECLWNWKGIEDQNYPERYAGSRAAIAFSPEMIEKAEPYEKKINALRKKVEEYASRYPSKDVREALLKQLRNDQDKISVPTGFSEEANEKSRTEQWEKVQEAQKVKVAKSDKSANKEDAAKHLTGRSRVILNESEFNRTGWTAIADATVGNKFPVPMPGDMPSHYLEILEVSKESCRFRVAVEGRGDDGKYFLLPLNSARVDDISGIRLHTLLVDSEKEKSPLLMARIDASMGRPFSFGDTRRARYYLENPNEAVPLPLRDRERYDLHPVKSSKPEPDKESTLEPQSIEPSEKTVKVAKPITGLSIKELNQRGWQAFYQGKNKEAEADFREILSRDKKHLAAINGLGFALLNQGNHKEAKPLFKSYLKQDKKALGPMNGLARCLQAEGDLDGAIKVWEEGVKINLGPTALSSGLAFAYLEKKEYAKAIPLFEMLAKSDPKNTFYSDGLAKAKAALAEPSKAE